MTYHPTRTPARGRRNKAAIIGLAALAAVTIACGAGESTVSGSDTEADPPAAAESNTGTQQLTKKVGETLTVSNDSTAVNYTLAKVEQKASDSLGLKPNRGVYLLVQLNVQVTKGDAFVCSCELSFVAKDGTVSEETFASFDGRPTFQSADVAAGQKTSGWIIFDVPKAAVKGGKIQLKVTNLLADNEYAYWAL